MILQGTVAKQSIDCGSGMGWDDVINKRQAGDCVPIAGSTIASRRLDCVDLGESWLPRPPEAPNAWPVVDELNKQFPRNV